MLRSCARGLFGDNLEAPNDQNGSGTLAVAKESDGTATGLLAAGRRALRLIEIVAHHPDGCSFSTLSAQTGLSSASMSRLLKTLVAEQWLVHATRDAPYTAGARLCGLGERMALPGASATQRVARTGHPPQAAERLDRSTGMS